VTIAKVRDNASGSLGGSGTARTLALTTGYTAGDFIAIFLRYNCASSGTLSSVTDGNGNPYSIALDVADSNNIHTAIILCFTVSTGGTTTVTFNFTQTYVLGGASISEWSFTTHPTVVDKTASNTQVAATALSTGTTAATTGTSELALAVFGTYNAAALNGNTTTTPASYIALPTVNDSSGTDYIFPFYQILAATGAQSAASTLTDANIASSASMIVCVAEPAAGGGPQIGIPQVPAIPQIPTVR
jgi:hypothetical protein